jgi:hypothetical protein
MNVSPEGAPVEDAEFGGLSAVETAAMYTVYTKIGEKSKDSVDAVLHPF